MIVLAIWALLFRAATANAVTLHIDEPEQLQALQQQGLSFAQRLTGKMAHNNAKLLQQPLYKSLVEDIQSDLDQRLANDSRLSVTMAKAHRLFDGRWLSSAAAKFELIGVVNRFDRMREGHCGEMRLIYRLAYQMPDKRYSRLPMTVNLVHQQPGPDCRAAARQWQRTRWKTGAAERLKDMLGKLLSVEINLQAIRWPSTVRPDMGGYAEYLLRAYRINGQTLQRKWLENTPDVAKLKKTPALKNELKQWLLKNAVAIDNGTARVPEKFLVKAVSSHALHGIERLPNRLFDQLYSVEDFRSIDFSTLTHAKGSQAFLRRLDNLTCNGCHQSRSIAGFHFAGKDLPNTHALNSVAVAQSGHFLADQKRRIAQWKAVLKTGKTDGAQGFAERNTAAPGQRGAHCSVSQQLPNWSCVEGLSCQLQDTAKGKVGELVGRCASPQPKLAGEACTVGRITQYANPTKDRVIDVVEAASNLCLTTTGGFPGGMISGGCWWLDDQETCGAIASLSGFNACLARKEPFADCLSNYSSPMALQACDENTACRDDYICARTRDGAGGCIPPYFLFQLRVDGHPKPPGY